MIEYLMCPNVSVGLGLGLELESQSCLMWEDEHYTL